MCLAVVRREQRPEVLRGSSSCAVARLAPEDAMNGLLEILSNVESRDVQETSLVSLDALTLRLGKVPSSLSERDPSLPPDVRAARGYLLARRGDEKQRADAKRGLNDPDPSVRLRTAQGFLGRHEKDGLPTLIGLLERAPLSMAWQLSGRVIAIRRGRGDSAGRIRRPGRGWWPEEVSNGLGGVVETEREHSRLTQPSGRIAPADFATHVFGGGVR